MNDIEIKSEDVQILIKMSQTIIDQHNEFLKKIVILKDHKTKKHMRSISDLDRKANKYLKGIRQEQDKINKFKRISLHNGVSLPMETTTSFLPPVSESIDVVNENTGERVQLSDDEIKSLRELSGEN